VQIKETLSAIDTRRAEAILDVWALVLPPRVSKEMVGDFLEDIHRRAGAGQPSWRIYLRMIAAIYYTAVNAIGHVRKEFGRKA
jgi:hypothetical protein